MRAVAAPPDERESEGFAAELRQSVAWVSAGGSDVRELWASFAGGVAVVAAILLACVPRAAVAGASSVER
ncbi:hypothetical protein GCM10022419_133990 [Nonomuraea rosea]|uniref:Uncharacterized protein n=1 Tax=Nonomuraea rosea TaxID=638574 RepID=A0ABP7A5X7_9ACTN